MATTNYTHESQESVLWNNAEVITPLDLNSMSRFSERRMVDYLMRPLLLDGFDDGTLLQARPVGGAFSIREAAVPAMTVRVYPGTLLFRSATDPGQPEPQWMMHRTTAIQSITVDTADATNPRIDILTYKVEYDALDTGSVDAVARVTKTVGGAYTSSTLDKRRRTLLTITYTPGTPAGSPVAPATPAGHVKFAEISVPATDTTISTAQITDYRVPVGSRYIRQFARDIFVFNTTTGAIGDGALFGAGGAAFGEVLMNSADHTIHCNISPEEHALDAEVDTDFCLAHYRLRSVTVHCRITHGGTGGVNLRTELGVFADISSVVTSNVLGEYTYTPTTPLWSMGEINPWRAIDTGVGPPDDPPFLQFNSGGTTDLFRRVWAEWYGF